MPTTKDAIPATRWPTPPDEVAIAGGQGMKLIVGRIGSYERDGERQPLLVTVEEAAKMLCIGRTVAYQLMQKREIRSIKIGRTRRVVLTSIGEYVRRLTDEAN